MTNKFNQIIVHHTAVRQTAHSRQFEIVRRYHTQTRGWVDIAYHWFIEPNGNLIKGRDESIVRNGRLNVCLAGNFEIEEPKKEQIITLEKFLDDKRTEFNIPRANVLGHQEVGATLCPGRNLMPFVRTYRARLEQSENNKQIILGLIKEIEERLNQIKKEVEK
jgi:hypothetical protein